MTKMRRGGRRQIRQTGRRSDRHNRARRARARVSNRPRQPNLRPRSKCSAVQNRRSW
jgi:hypothetical protein